MVKDFPTFHGQMFLGGPVKTDSLFFIHTLGEMVEDSIEIMDGLYWGGDVQIIKELISINRISPGEIKFFAGYSGWVAKQLEGELTKNSWLVSNIKTNQVMSGDPETLWDNTLQELGEEYEFWTTLPNDPTLN